MAVIYKSKWILPANGGVIENSAFVVENGIITDILLFDELKKADYKEFELIDFGNSVITPGFINLHTHLQFTALGKFPQENGKSDFVRWITSLIKQYGNLSPEQKLQSFKMGVRQALLSGTTCIAQLSKEEEFFEILCSLPIKAYVFFEVFADSKESACRAFNDFKEKHERLTAKLNDSTFIGISPHSIYTVHKDLWGEISEYSQQNDLLVHTHLAESKEEIDWVKHGATKLEEITNFTKTNPLKPDKQYKNPVEYLLELGMLNDRLITAHLNQLDDKALELLAGNCAGVVSCPRSNLLLHGNTLNIQKALVVFKDRIGIGTDSLYSNGDLNMLNEAKTIANLKTGREQDLFILLDMLTINSAKILRLDNKIGSLEIGKDADFNVFKLDENESYKDLLQKESPNHVYIKGQQIVNAGKTTDEFK